MRESACSQASEGREKQVPQLAQGAACAPMGGTCLQGVGVGLRLGSRRAAPFAAGFAAGFRGRRPPDTWAEQAPDVGGLEFRGRLKSR